MSGINDTSTVLDPVAYTFRLSNVDGKLKSQSFSHSEEDVRGLSPRISENDSVVSSALHELRYWSFDDPLPIRDPSALGKISSLMAFYELDKSDPGKISTLITFYESGLDNSNHPLNHL